MKQNSTSRQDSRCSNEKICVYLKNIEKDIMLKKENKNAYKCITKMHKIKQRKIEENCSYLPLIYFFFP